MSLADLNVHDIPTVPREEQLCGFNSVLWFIFAFLLLLLRLLVIMYAWSGVLFF